MRFRAPLVAQMHGIYGRQTHCGPTKRPAIAHLDDGCTSDTYRCVAAYTPPKFPACACAGYASGAAPTSTDGLCEKKGDKICYPPNYAGDKKIGNADNYGCPEDMCAPALAPARATPPGRRHSALAGARRECRL